MAYNSKIRTPYEVWPVTIIADRYTGAYSGCLFTAWNCEQNLVPGDVCESDGDCADFWNTYTGIVGKGCTPDDAWKDLVEKLNNQ